MAGNEGQKEKEIDLRELANLDSFGDILTEIKSSCVEQIQEKASLLWDTMESNLVEANEILFGETALPSEIPIAGKQQVQEIKTRLENSDNDVLNADSATTQTQGIRNDKWKPILSSVRSTIKLQNKTSPCEKTLMNAVAKLDVIGKSCDEEFQKYEISAKNFAVMLLKYQANKLKQSLYELNPLPYLNDAFGDANPSQMSPDCLIRNDLKTNEPRYSAAALGKKRTFYKSVMLAYDNVTELGGQYYSNLEKTASEYKKKIFRPEPVVISGQLQEIITKAELGPRSETTLRKAPAAWNAMDTGSQIHSNEVERNKNSVTSTDRLPLNEKSTDYSVFVYVVITSAFYLGCGYIFNTSLLQDDQPPS